MEALAEQIRPGAGLDEGVVAALATDPTTLAGSPEEFRTLMLERERSAMEELEGTHFEIPEQIRTIDVRLAPKGAALGAVLHPAVGGLHPARHHLVVARRQGAGADLGRGHDRLPRGLPGPSPPVRPAGVPG